MVFNPLSMMVQSGRRNRQGLSAPSASGARIRLGLSPVDSPPAKPLVSKTYWVRKPLFWRTVNRAAFGGKSRYWFDFFSGLWLYPFTLVRFTWRWFFGSQAGFKRAHPLAALDQKALLQRIELLNQQIPVASFRFISNASDLAASQVHKNRLLKVHDALVGLQELLAAHDWRSTATALEHYLSASGKNNGHSCANVALAHAQKLAHGSFLKREKLYEPEVSYVPVGPAVKREAIVLGSKAYQNAQEREFKGMLPQEIQAGTQAGEKALQSKLGLQHAPRSIDNVALVEEALLKAGAGAQAFVLDLCGNRGHVSLAVNLKGRIYHIDNLETQSAKVSQLAGWAEQKAPRRLWYALVKDPAHPALAQEKGPLRAC